MAESSADLINQLISARHDPARVRGVLADHLSTRTPLAYTQDMAVATCGLTRVLHLLGHEVPGVDAYLEHVLAEGPDTDH